MKEYTFRTNHPDIPFIKMGDTFVTDGGDIVEFVGFNIHEDKHKYPLVFKSTEIKMKYTKKLTYRFDEKSNSLDIKERYITLKDKIDLL
jgi:hypothetical protein